MPKPEWGVKRLCPQCETRFYDLQNDPILCPECGATCTVDAHGKVSATQESQSARPAKAEDDDLVDDEDDGGLLEDDDDDADDDESDERDPKGPALSDEDDGGTAFQDPDLLDKSGNESEDADEDGDGDDSRKEDDDDEG